MDFCRDFEALFPGGSVAPYFRGTEVNRRRMRWEIEEFWDRYKTTIARETHCAEDAFDGGWSDEHAEQIFAVSFVTALRLRQAADRRRSLGRLRLSIVGDAPAPGLAAAARPAAGTSWG